MANRYRVRAYNTATASTNKIHDDDVARSLGFRGGLVPGVDVYAYLCHLPAERWGRAWLERGTITARFVSPVYDGDQVEIASASESASAPTPLRTPSGDDQLGLTLTDPAGATCAVARASLPSDAESASCPDAGLWPSAAPPLDPPPASAELLTDAELGSIEATFLAERAAEYLHDIRERLPLFGEQRLAHPGWLLRFANYVLTANVRLGPWIHVESSVQFFGVVSDGDRVETRALVAGVAERSGHHFVDLDVLQLVGDRVIARTAHTAIYRPRGTELSGLS
jgi:acyl dehydratase